MIRVCVATDVGAPGVGCAAARDSMTRNHVAQVDTCLVLLAATSRDEAMAVMEEEDLDAVAEAWGGEEEDTTPGEPTEGLDEEMEGFEDAGANGDEDEEGGWDMEVTQFHYAIQHPGSIANLHAH